MDDVLRETPVSQEMTISSTTVVVIQISWAGLRLTLPLIMHLDGFP
jgi:hypothetical protein